MDFFHFFITIMVVVVILLIAIGIGWWTRNHVRHENIPPPNPLLTNVSHWSKPATPSTDPTKNVCTLYNFPSSSVVIDGVPTFVPGAATLNSQTLDSLLGTTEDIPVCIDADQIVAQQVAHECQAINSDQPSLISLCETLVGERVKAGTVETFYQKCSHPTCPGEMALVSINYQVPSNLATRCLTRTNGDVLMMPCDPMDTEQRFRLTRINPGQNPGSLTSGQGQTGLIAQILYRSTGLCLSRGASKSSTTFDPAYAKCGTGPGHIEEGWSVVMAPCKSTDTDVYSGYDWLMLPSFQYCGVADGCKGCTGNKVCSRVPGSNNCHGDTGCTGSEPMTIAPQLIYIGDLDISKIPISSAGYKGLFGLNAIYKWAMDEGATSLYYGGSGSGLILRDLAGDISQCINSGYVGQYLNVSTYNQLSKLKVCTADRENSPTSCLGF